MIFSSRAGFCYPIEPAPRTAVLVDWFGHGWFKAAVRVFPRGWCGEASRFSPASIAGTLQQFVELADRANPPVPTHALVVLARRDQPMLSASDRERLWRAFRVPLFEQVIGARGELLAAECEAHAGLHIETPGLALAGYTTETAPCACGRATPRLTPADRLEPIRRVAAYAR
jgi:hypothetical protein